MSAQVEPAQLGECFAEILLSDGRSAAIHHVPLSLYDNILAIESLNMRLAYIISEVVLIDNESVSYFQAYAMRGRDAMAIGKQLFEHTIIN